MTPPQGADWLHHFPPLADGGDELGRLLGAARRVHLPAAARVFTEGDACPNFLLVIEGSVRVQKLSEQGRELVLYRVEAGQSCILTTACVLGGGRYHAEAISESEVDAVVIPRELFERALTGSAAFRTFVFQAYGERLGGLMALIDAVAFGRMDSRLAALLLERAEANLLHTTHQQLARELGSAREVVSRLLKEFERHGWLEVGRGALRLCDTEALARLASGEGR